MLKVEMKGGRYGRLLVLEEAGRDTKGNVTWWCRCNHGGKGRPKRLIVSGIKLRQGDVKSCGCLRHDTSVARGRSFLRHGMSRHPLYRAWRNMKARCLDPSRKEYRRYGGRGISVCREWMKSDDFLAWAKTHGYRRGLTLDRRENDGDYTPDNCRFVTRLEQQKNRATCRKLDSDRRAD